VKIKKAFLIFLFIQSCFLGVAYSSLAVSEEIWDLIEPYLLPDDHPIKTKMDNLFADPHLLDSEKTLKRRGFDLSKSQKQLNHVKVASHKKLKNYLIKTYTNDQIAFEECFPLVIRVVKAQLVQAALDRLHYNGLFKVPKKWIYLLPHASQIPHQRKCVLVVEDMKLHSEKANQSLWKNPRQVTLEKLFALYTLLSQEGLMGSIYIDNIPFALDGKIAIIDTEHVHVWPVKYRKLTKRLPKELQNDWINLIEQGDQESIAKID
jgi:hypothetical protein